MQEASPQIEDGFTRIANELFEAVLGFGFSQRQLLVLLTVLRKTYGFGKKEDDMSASQISEVCKVGRQHVTTVLGELARMNVITKSPGRFGMVVGINKRYGEWLPLERATKVGVELAPSATEVESGSPESGQVSQTRTSPDKGHVLNREFSSPDSGQVDSPKSGHTKENLPKETQKKGRVRRDEISLTDWLAACKASGELSIPKDDPIFDYAEKQALSVEFVRYAWLEFRRKYTESGKKQKDWRATFRNAVRENWYGLWFKKDDEFLLTTRGQQVKTEHEIQ
ncbi:replication protein [Burkholderia gladioli]|uniref:replication protein n=1 Tax=Burkholderia gladioli TaxID=28095 RepID=UPI001CC60FC5|nr:replication protein [Burkholderia gladioli]